MPVSLVGFSEPYLHERHWIASSVVRERQGVANEGYGSEKEGRRKKRDKDIYVT
jgi:hypothetical protein